jgi:hypothetical protein
MTQQFFRYVTFHLSSENCTIHHFKWRSNKLACLSMSDTCARSLILVIMARSGEGSRGEQRGAEGSRGEQRGVEGNIAEGSGAE